MEDPGTLNGRPIVCTVCGGDAFAYGKLLDRRLIADWRLSEAEADYINRQQGYHCRRCGANLRSIALAKALSTALGWPGTLGELVEAGAAAGVSLLEVNEAGHLHRLLRTLPGHVLAAYPAVDICAMPYADGRFDLVVHSDTLEHIGDPSQALAECHRVLKDGGACVFTVPTVVGRMSRSRAGLTKSFHGDYDLAAEDYVVHTEFGADLWTYAGRAGFAEVRLTLVDFPAAVAVTAVKAPVGRHPAERRSPEVELAACRAALAAVLASTSWRLTAPLRRLKLWTRF